MIAGQGRLRRHVKCGKALYSVPWRLIGQPVDIRATATMVQIFHQGELVKTHVRKDKGKVTDIADYLLVTWNLTAGENRLPAV